MPVSVEGPRAELAAPPHRSYRRLLVRRLAMLSLSGCLLLAACGGSSGDASDGASSAAPSAAASAAGTPAPDGSAAPQASAAPALPIVDTVNFTASGAFGDKPTLTFSGEPGKALGVKVLTQGTGPEVKAGEILDADYIGQIWKGKVFDNSYDKGSGAAFPIGLGKVIPGWDHALVGKKVGSRVLLSIPPAEGYGTTGQAQAGIKGTDTLAFVVDIAGTFSKDATGQKDAADQKVSVPSGLTVKGSIGAPVTITASKDYKAPAKNTLTVLAKGTGKPIESAALVQYAAAQPGGQSESSWTNGGPQSVPVSDPQAGPFQLLKGVPLGSRVLLEVPADTAAGTTTAVFVVDLVGVPQSAKDSLS